MRIWSDVEYVYRCLADSERTAAFQAAIRAAVRPGDVVLDLGTGSGIMAITAAKAGARKVYATEIGPYLARAAQAAFERNGCGSVIELLHRDARDIGLLLLEKPDVVVCEMITTGLIGEMQGTVIKALQQASLLSPGTIVIPAGLDTSVACVTADFTFFGAIVPLPLFVNYFSKSFDERHTALSEEKRGHSVNFAADFEERVVISEKVRILRAGMLNGILLRSHTRFADGSVLEDTISYCQPVILPVDEMYVLPGDSVGVSVEYRMSEGFDSLTCAAWRQ